MWDLIKELRRRSIFRSAGIYVGTAWILIEGASVVLPTFNAPDAAMRWLVIAAFTGFPIAMVLAWIFELTERGILRTDAADNIVTPQAGVRTTDFVAIGALSLALIFSIYLNMQSQPAAPTAQEPVSILVANFDNNTGNPLFDVVLEQVVSIGIEVAPFVASYDRVSALLELQAFSPGDELNSAGASTIAGQLEIDRVVSGKIERQGSGYGIEISVTDISDASNRMDVSGGARTNADVFKTVDELVSNIREALGADSANSAGDPATESFNAVSLEAAKFFVVANSHAAIEDCEGALQSYRLAIDADPDFGRAYAAAAVCAFKLGKKEQAEHLWERVQPLLNTMTERERFRVLGQYHLMASDDFELALENFANLVEKYPADAAGHNSLAAASFLAGDYDRAANEEQSALTVFPNSARYRLDLASYAMYAGRFDIADQEARKVVEMSPDYGDAYFPLAMAAMARNDLDAARDAYRQMSLVAKDGHADSLAALGLSDIEIYAGNFDAALALLRAGISADLRSGNHRAASVKHLALAQALLASGQTNAAEKAADQAMRLGDDESRNDSLKVAAGMIFLQTGADDKAGAIAVELQQQVKMHSRAYGLMLQSILRRNSGEYAKSRNLMRNALSVADLWLIRFQLGQTYLASEQFVEALDEFTIVEQRLGEATAVFLDDTPTYRYFAAQPYWKGRAQEGLNMQSAATGNYQAFLTRWAGSGPLMDDARKRLSEYRAR